MVAAIRADEQGRGIARRDALGAHIDAVIRIGVARQIDDGLGRGGLGRDADQARRCVGATAGFGRAVDVVGNGEIGDLRRVDDLDANRRIGRVVGEGDAGLRLPRCRCQLHRRLADRDARLVRRLDFAARQKRREHQRHGGRQNLQSQHDTHPLKHAPKLRGMVRRV